MREAERQSNDGQDNGTGSAGAGKPASGRRRSLQESRSEETKRHILEAAEELFAAKGFEAVTMREIAKQAGCSHTSIHLYFKDKETLLHLLALPQLEQLERQLAGRLAEAAEPEEAVTGMALTFIRFCLERRSAIRLLIEQESERVDEANPQFQLNEVRNRMFGYLREGLLRCLPQGRAENGGLREARIFFYLLYGMIMTYRQSRETPEELMERLDGTFQAAIRTLLQGFRSESEWAADPARTPNLAP